MVDSMSVPAVYGQSYRSHTISLDVLEGLGGACAPPVISFNLYSAVPRPGPGKVRNFYTSQMRVGEVWALFYDMVANKVVESNCTFKLTGTDDEVLRQFRRLNPMISRTDGEAFQEALRLSRDQSESMLVRIVAFSTMWGKARVRETDQWIPDRMLIAQREVCAILANENSPPEMRYIAFRNCRIDARVPLEPQSPATEILSRLIKMVLSEQDTDILTMVCDQLDEAKRQSIGLFGLSADVLYPQIARVLEVRAEIDAKAGKTPNVAADRVASMEHWQNKRPQSYSFDGPFNAAVELWIPGLALPGDPMGPQPAARYYEPVPQATYPATGGIVFPKRVAPRVIDLRRVKLGGQQ